MGELACNDKNSREYAGLYEFLLTLFIEVDVKCKGVITYEEFSGLIERAASVPRSLAWLLPLALQGSATQSSTAWIPTTPVRSPSASSSIGLSTSSAGRWPPRRRARATRSEGAFLIRYCPCFSCGVTI